MYVHRNEYGTRFDFGVNRRPFSSIFLDKRRDYFVTFSRKTRFIATFACEYVALDTLPENNCEHAESTMPAPIKFMFGLLLCRHKYKMSIHFGEIRSSICSILRKKRAFRAYSL